MTRSFHVSPESWRAPLIALVGLGAAREDMSARALSWVGRAEALVGGRRQLESFPDHTGERVEIKGPLDALLDRVDELSKLRRTAVLASGDPLFFGIGRRLSKHFGPDRLFVLPGVTSVQALFARLAEPWDEVRVMSLHGRGGEQEFAWLDVLRAGARLALYTDAHHTPGWIAGKMAEAGLNGFDLVVGEDLGLETERVRRLTTDEAVRLEFSPLNLVAVLPNSAAGFADVETSFPPLLGLPDEAFSHQAGLITKMEVRAVALALLQPGSGQVLWDLGAASGSVSIEAARLAPLREVFAVEKDENRYKDLVGNVERFGLKRFHCIHSRASEALDGLPDPDRVFIGGSGSDLTRMLDRIAMRLRPGGRIVQTAVTLDTLDAARGFWRARPFEISITQVQVNRSVPIGQSLRFESLNPVFIIAAWRKSS